MTCVGSPRGASLGRKQTCGISSSRVRGHVQQSMGKHATVRWATRKAARWYAKWGPVGLPRAPGGPARGGSPTRVSVSCLMVAASVRVSWGALGCVGCHHHFGVMVSFEGVLLHRASFFLHPVGARPVGRPHPGLLLPSFCHQVRLHLRAEGGLHHQSWPEG